VYNTVWAAAASAFASPASASSERLSRSSRRAGSLTLMVCSTRHALHADPPRQIAQGGHHLGPVEFAVGAPYPGWRCDTFPRGGTSHFPSDSIFVRNDSSIVRMYPPYLSAGKQPAAG
jgi:hypothetical protein